jgi:hypothetical protein
MVILRADICERIKQHKPLLNALSDACGFIEKRTILRYLDKNEGNGPLTSLGILYCIGSYLEMDIMDMVRISEEHYPKFKPKLNTENTADMGVSARRSSL